MTSPALSQTSIDDRAAGTTSGSTSRASPAPWILGWAAYSLLALGYFGYQSAWLSGLCLTR